MKTHYMDVVSTLSKYKKEYASELMKKRLFYGIVEYKQSDGTTKHHMDKNALMR